MKRKLSFLILIFFFFSSCGIYFPVSQSTEIEPEATPNVSGEPSYYSQEIYESVDLTVLCTADECQPEYPVLSDDYNEYYDSEVPAVCAFDDNPNQTSQFILHKDPEGVNGLKLLMSKEDLFFLAWVSMRYQVNPHFLLGVMSQESYGNCAAVSYANAEGCFQITNDYGRAQLEESYEDRVNNWYWADDPSGYYPDSVFVNSTDWFGEEPETEQYRMTLDPSSASVLGVDVSSVVNFNFGVIGSALYYNWEQYFLYNQYSSLRTTVKNIISSQEEAKASLMAAAYNGGISRLTSSLQSYGSNYLNGMAYETQDYVGKVLDYCEGFQEGSSWYTASYTADNLDSLIDLLALTYDASLEIDWDSLKQDIRDNFFSGQDELTLVDDMKALIYYISTYDSSLAPEWPEM